MSTALINAIRELIRAEIRCMEAEKLPSNTHYGRDERYEADVNMRSMVYVLSAELTRSDVNRDRG